MSGLPSLTMPSKTGLTCCKNPVPQPCQSPVQGPPEALRQPAPLIWACLHHLSTSHQARSGWRASLPGSASPSPSTQHLLTVSSVPETHRPGHMPLPTQIHAGDAGSMIHDLPAPAPHAAQVVLAPVVAGALLNRTFPRQVARAAAFTPLLAVAMTVAICASIIAASAGSIQSVGLPLLLAVTALHIGEHHPQP